MYHCNQMACGEGGGGGEWLPRHGEYWPWPFCPADVMSRGARSGDVYNKSAIFINLIATDKPYICTIVETWNDSADCFNLAARTSPDYGCLVRARLRLVGQAANIRTNNVSVCLPYMYGDVLCSSSITYGLHDVRNPRR